MKRAKQTTTEVSNAAKAISPFRFNSLLRLEKDPKRALLLFLNPNPTTASNPNSKTKPFRYTDLSYDLIIAKLGKAKLFQELEQVLNKLKDDTRIIPKEIVLCNVITYYGRARLPRKALQMFDEIPSFRSKRTIKSFNTLLNCLLKCEEFEKMSDLFVNIEKYGNPDACTYNILMNWYCARGDLVGAWDVFGEMCRRRVVPNVVTFGTLINGICQITGELGKAFQLKERMVGEFKIKPNAFVYVALIKGLCKVNEVDKAVQLKEEMLREKVELDSAVYSSLISAFFKCGRKREVSRLLEEMKDNACKPSVVTYNTMIFGFCGESDFDSALGVLSEMEEKGCKPDVVSYNIIIGALCREGKYSEANDLLEDMPRRKCFPDVVTYRTMFDALCNGKRYREAGCILDEMIFKGHIPRAASISKFAAGVVSEENTELLLTALNSLAKQNSIDPDVWRTLISLVCKEDQEFSSSEFVSGLIPS